ncbi:MAG: hypothetical protein AABX85_04855 [Nanoarchaeota archaeon]
MKSKLTDVYEKIVSNDFFVDGSAFLWTNFPRLGIELMTGVDSNTSANSMIGASIAKPIFGKIYKVGRDKSMNLLEKIGWIDVKKKDGGKKNCDRVYGPLIAFGEGAINGLAYLTLYGETSVKKAFLAGAGSAAFTALGNLNGRMLDTVCVLNNLPNKGRSFIPENTPIEMKKRIRDNYNAMMVGFPAAYIFGVKLIMPYIYGN